MLRVILPFLALTVASTPAFAMGQKLKDKAQFQLGDHWDKKPITGKNIQKVPAAVANLARHTALIRYIKPSGNLEVGTAFFAGKFQGKFLFVTNHHVIDSQETCNKALIVFADGGSTISTRMLECDQLLLTLSQSQGSDVTLFTVKYNKVAADPASIKKFGLEPVIEGLSGLELDFSNTSEPRQQVAQAGFGLAGKTMSTLDILTGDWSPDCQVISTGRYAPQDKFGSLAISCDVSNGDSGSALIDLHSGKVVGLVWGSGSSALSSVQDKRAIRSKELSSLINTPGSPTIWNNLNYAIPAHLLKEKVLTAINEPGSSISESTRSLIQEFLSK